VILKIKISPYLYELSLKNIKNSIIDALNSRTQKSIESIDHGFCDRRQP
jgi:hypothetical protein